MIKKICLTSLLLLPSLSTVAENNIDLSGDWIISSSVGGEIPITVLCTFIQEDSMLSGFCTPVMENPEPSDLTGEIRDDSATWGYKVVFNGNPGTVDFMADSISNTEITGTLSLSGTTAPFSASRE